MVPLLFGGGSCGLWPSEGSGYWGYLPFTVFPNAKALGASDRGSPRTHPLQNGGFWVGTGYNLQIVATRANKVFETYPEDDWECPPGAL